jgi:predicted Zn-dependent protease
MASTVGLVVWCGLMDGRDAQRALAAQEPTSTVPAISGEIYLVPLGEFPQPRVLALQNHYQHKLGLPVRSVAAIPFDLGTVDPERQQLFFEDVAEHIQRSYRLLAENRRVVLIGLTTRDMRHRSQGTWSMSGRTDRLAVISTARLDNTFWGLPSDEAWLQERLQKLVTRSIGFVYYGLPASSDPRNVLYEQLNSIPALDEMTEEFDPVKVAVATPGRSFPTVVPITTPPAEMFDDTEREDPFFTPNRTVMVVTVGFFVALLLGLILVGAIEAWERAGS